ncbi:MAG: hypothetical protein Q9168_004884 [Polycauliona sp. 1 TL-2023]
MDSPKADEDAAIKQRIITHMNTSHQDSLIRYLRHTHHLSSYAARNATLQSLTLDSLTLTTSSLSSSTSKADTYLVPITPLLQTYSSARTRLADLDAAAVAALGVSPITLKRYIPPYSHLHRAIFIYVIVVLVTFPLFSILPRSTIQSFFSSLPLPHPYGLKIMRFFYAVQPWILSIIAAIHPLEAWWMHRTRLTRYNVCMGGKVWWLWMGSTFIEGFGAFQRVGAEIRSEQLKKEKAKH